MSSRKMIRASAALGAREARILKPPPSWMKSWIRYCWDQYFKIIGNNRTGAAGHLHGRPSGDVTTPNARDDILIAPRMKVKAKVRGHMLRLLLYHHVIVKVSQCLDAHWRGQEPLRVRPQSSIKHFIFPRETTFYLEIRKFQKEVSCRILRDEMTIPKSPNEYVRCQIVILC